MSSMIMFIPSPSAVLTVLVPSVVSSDSQQCPLRWVVATKEVDEVSQVLYP